MVVQYTIAGRQVGAHVLSMATLGTAGLGGFLAFGGSKKSTEQGPPINATNSDEEKFIKDFMQKAEAEEKKTVSDPPTT
ncbi:MAG: hypothetical protein M1812_003071 [Candelaria pacifica]|nr:MAG: hypothetical protein M1812_003071 [Candelaria pacifica]